MVKGSQSLANTLKICVVLALASMLADRHIGMVHACRSASRMIASGCEDGTFRIWDLRSFQVCLLPKHFFSFGINQWVNLRVPLRQCCKEWCKCFFGHPKKWKMLQP